MGRVQVRIEDGRGRRDHAEREEDAALARARLEEHDGAAEHEEEETGDQRLHDEAPEPLERDRPRGDVDLHELVAARDEVVEDRSRRMPLDLRGELGGRREDAAVQRHHLVEWLEDAALAAADDHQEVLHDGVAGARLSHAPPGVVGGDRGHEQTEAEQNRGDGQLGTTPSLEHLQQSTLSR